MNHLWYTSICYLFLNFKMYRNSSEYIYIEAQKYAQKHLELFYHHYISVFSEILLQGEK